MENMGQGSSSWPTGSNYGKRTRKSTATASSHISGLFPKKSKKSRRKSQSSTKEKEIRWAATAKNKKNNKAINFPPIFFFVTLKSKQAKETKKKPFFLSLSLSHSYTVSGREVNTSRINIRRIEIESTKHNTKPNNSKS